MCTKPFQMPKFLTFRDTWIRLSQPQKSFSARIQAHTYSRGVPLWSKISQESSQQTHSSFSFTPTSGIDTLTDWKCWLKWKYFKPQLEIWNPILCRFSSSQFWTSPDYCKKRLCQAPTSPQQTYSSSRHSHKERMASTSFLTLSRSITTWLLLSRSMPVYASLVLVGSLPGSSLRSS